MNKLLTMIYAYYNCPMMYHEQMYHWGKYSESVRNQIEIITVDDCSNREKTIPINIIQHLQQRYFRIKYKVPFNYLAARNIGVHHASGKWIVILDVDHVMKRDTLEPLLLMLSTLDESRSYMFSRMNVDGSERGPHRRLLLMTKNLFWKAGGYDESFSGVYYQSSIWFYNKLKKVSGNPILINLPLTVYTNNDVEDAECTEFEKNKLKDMKKVSNILLMKKKKCSKSKTMSFPYTEL